MTTRALGLDCTHEPAPAVQLSRGKAEAQRLKPPLLRGIELAQQSLEIIGFVLDVLRFHAERVKIDPSVHAATEAHAPLVSEGVPFRDAHRRIAARFAPGDT